MLRAAYPMSPETLIGRDREPATGSRRAAPTAMDPIPLTANELRQPGVTSTQPADDGFKKDEAWPSIAQSPFNQSSTPARANKPPYDRSPWLPTLAPPNAALQSKRGCCTWAASGLAAATRIAATHAAPDVRRFLNGIATTSSRARANASRSPARRDRPQPEFLNRSRLRRYSGSVCPV